MSLEVVVYQLTRKGVHTRRFTQDCSTWKADEVQYINVPWDEHGVIPIKPGLFLNTILKQITKEGVTTIVTVDTDGTLALSLTSQKFGSFDLLQTEIPSQEEYLRILSERVESRKQSPSSPQ